MLRNWIVPVVIAAFWISLSEFARNELWLKADWIEHYNQMGLNFPDSAVNGLVWVLWSLALASGIALLISRLSFFETFAVTWLFAFGLMWIVTGNMGVLPYSILPYALPLSLVELVVAIWIIQSFKTRLANS